MVYNNVLETIGQTPIVELHKVTASVAGRVFAKLDFFNPGHSSKDRIAMYMIEQAEQKGLLQPGGTLVEATSGNTGFSLAMIAAVKGYKCILTVTDKISNEKVDMLRALGAEIVKCPKNAKPDAPDSYYSMAKSIAESTPNAYYVNQNYNTDNAQAHYLSTGPEIWEQTKGQITCLVASAGTAGTLCGTARYLKEKNPNIKVVAVDAVGSILTHYFKTGIYDLSKLASYRIEGTGKNIIPANLDVSLIDRFEQVPDEESAYMTRALAKEEGIVGGYSSGAAIQCVKQLGDFLNEDDYTVMILPDHGSKYLGKVYNDDWMVEQGFIDAPKPKPKNGREKVSMLTSLTRFFGF